MQRSQSVYYESELCPWSWQEDEPIFDKINRNDIKIQKKQQTPAQCSPGKDIKQFHSLSATIQQHRQKLLKSKLDEIKSIQIKPYDAQNKILKVKASQREEMQIIESAKMRMTMELAYRRSKTLSKLSEQNEIRSFNPGITPLVEQERQKIKTFYRPRTTFKNANKYYGNLKKKPQISISRLSGSILHSKETASSNLISKKLYQGLKPLKRPPKSIVQIKLRNYKSLKSVEKLRQMAEQRPLKKLKQQSHVLDRILVNNR